MAVIRRALLALEILGAYRHARRVLARPLPDAVASQRAVDSAVAPHLKSSLAEGRRLGRATLRVLRIVPTDARCLARSLTLTRLLARRGMAGTVVIGVRNDPEFAAHAWVELEGAPLLPDGGAEFTRLTEV